MIENVYYIVAVETRKVDTYTSTSINKLVAKLLIFYFFPILGIIQGKNDNEKKRNIRVFRI